MNERWRDYSKYTDKQLDDLLKGLAGQADYPAVAFEYQRRQNARFQADNRSRHEETQRLARWAMMFAALSVAIGIVFGLLPHRGNESPGNATHSDASAAPPAMPSQQPEAEEPRQMPATQPADQPTQPVTTPTPVEAQEEPPEEPQEDQPEALPEEPQDEEPEASPTPSS